MDNLYFVIVSVTKDDKHKIKLHILTTQKQSS